MNDLIDKLMDLYESYYEARAELKECEDGYEFDSDYLCQHHSQKCDELKDQIKATIKKIVEANNER